jgi:hypothetical protein
LSAAAETTWKQKRGRLARLSQDLPSDHPKVIELRGELKAQRLQEHIVKVIESAPPLTAEQRDRIAAILRGSGAV